MLTELRVPVAPDSIAAQARLVLADPGFEAAKACFCAGVTDVFARHRTMARIVNDAGNYGALAVLVAAQAGGGESWVPTRDIIAIVGRGAYISERRLTRLIARCADLGILTIRRDPGDGRVRMIRANAPIMDFFADWHAAHLAPLALLADGPGPQPSHASAALWQMIVVALKRQHDYSLVTPFPDIAELMRHARGYLAMLTLTLTPGTSARAVAQRFGTSETQARYMVQLVAELGTGCRDQWFATEIGFSALVGANCG